MSRSIDVTYTKPQADFLALTCRHPGLVMGMGGGKTTTMIDAGIMDALHSSSCSIAMYEPTFDLVTLTLAPRMQQRLSEFGIAHKYNQADHVVYTSSSQCGDFIFRSGDKPERIISYESYRAHLDELDTLKIDHAAHLWRKALERNRQAPKDLPNQYKVKSERTGRLEAFNRASVYTTPEGYKFVYNMWKKKGWNAETKTGNKEYQLIQASASSNPFNPDGYEDGLRAIYTEEQCQAFIEGQFVNLTTGTVYNAYKRNVHRSTETIKPQEDLYIGFDFNVNRMCYSVYVRRNLEWHLVEEGHNLYKTFDVRDSVQDRYLSKGHRVFGYPDATGKNQKSSSAETDIAILSATGIHMRYPKKNPDVRDRVHATNKAFQDLVLFVNYDTAPESANCFEQQAYDKNGAPDKDGIVDDQNDASTYVIAYERPIRKPFYKIDFDFSHFYRY